MSDWSDGVNSAMVSNTSPSSGLNLTGYLPALATLAGTMTQVSGYEKAAAATIQAGQAQQVQFQFRAEQERQNAGQAIAAGQQASLETLRQNKLVQSHALAIAAAGGSATSISFIRLMGRTAGIGSYQASMDLYKGEDAARVLNMQAEADDLSGAAALTNAENVASADQSKATGAVVSGAASLFSKYYSGQGLS